MNVVKVHTSLPPQIDRKESVYNLVFTISNIKYFTKSITNYDEIGVRVLWWGEQGNGSIFHPRCANLAGYKQITKTRAVYPINVQLDQFKSYLNDMGKLYVELINVSTKSIIGRTFIENIVSLGINKVLVQIVEILNDSNQKLAEISLRISMENTKNSSSLNIREKMENFTDKLLQNHPKPVNDDENKHLEQPEKPFEQVSHVKSSSEDLIDDLIQRSKRLREKISHDVEDAELPKDNEWLMDLFDESNISHTYPPSELHTKSLLKSSFKTKSSMNKRVDTEVENEDIAALKLITNTTESDISSSEDGIEDYEDILTKELLEKRNNRARISLDEPLLRESVIEELFYKQKDDSDKKNNSEDDEFERIPQKTGPKKMSDYEKYCNIIKETDSSNANMATNQQNNNKTNAPIQLDNNISQPQMDDSDWFNQIESIQLNVDTIWLNQNMPTSSNPSNCKNRRNQSNPRNTRLSRSFSDSRSLSRSQSRSPTLGGDRGANMRRSYESSVTNLASSKESLSIKPPVIPQKFKWNPNNSYFLDYKFPLCNTKQGSYKRVYLKSPNENQDMNPNNQSILTFPISHSSKFPVNLIESMSNKKWWKGVIRFRLICQDLDGKESVIGISTLGLRNIISTNNFYRLLPIRKPRKFTSDSSSSLVTSQDKSTSKISIIGSLAVRSKMLMPPTFEQPIMKSNQQKIWSAPSYDNDVRLSATMPNSKFTSKNNDFQPVSIMKKQLTIPRNTVEYCNTKLDPISLESLLLVSLVKNVKQRNANGSVSLRTNNPSSFNLYCVCRLLWCSDRPIKSRILYGCSDNRNMHGNNNDNTNVHDNFKLQQRLPLVLTKDLLEKLKNNYAILEIWDKSCNKISNNYSMNNKDNLYGIVKIPTNNFFLNYRYEPIRRSVLNNSFPVLSIDDWLDIQDPMTREVKGKVHVLLGMGTNEQINHLQSAKESHNTGEWARIINTGDGTMNGTSMGGNQNLVEHSLEIVIESLTGIQLHEFQTNPQNEDVYGFVQYYFPAQKTISNGQVNSWESVAYRTPCLPLSSLFVGGNQAEDYSELEFADSNNHRFRLPMEKSLKTLLHKYYQDNNKQRVLFEFYIKQYLPFPKIQPIAKGHIQLANLYRMINQHHTDDCTDLSNDNTVTQQPLSVKLVRSNNSDRDYGNYDDRDSYAGDGIFGTLNIKLCYKTKIIKTNSSSNSKHISPLNHSIVRVDVISGIGLQASVTDKTMLAQHPELQYPSITGLNCRVRYWISDDSKLSPSSNSIGSRNRPRSTSVQWRTFVPKFEHTSEFLIGPMIESDDYGENQSNFSMPTLAEKILSGAMKLYVELYHEIASSIYSDSMTTNQSTNEILLAKGRISLAELLLKSNSIMGPLWLPIFNPINLDSNYGGCRLNNKIVTKETSNVHNYHSYQTLFYNDCRVSGGAIEIKMSFLNKADRNNILQVAMDTGYVLPWTNRLETEDSIWQTMDNHGCQYKYVTLSVEEIDLATRMLNLIFNPDVGFSRSSIKLLTRYRLFKQPIKSSEAFTLCEEELGSDERLYIPINDTKQYCYRVSSELFRYLRESKLEIQLWGIYGNRTNLNSHQTDNDYFSMENDIELEMANKNDVRLIGSGFIELNSLILPIDQLEKKVKIIIPIWKRGLVDCGNSNITVTMDILGASTPLDDYNSDEDQGIEKFYGSNQSNKIQRKNQSIHSTLSNTNKRQNSFPVHVTIEKLVNIQPKQEYSDDNDKSKDSNYFVAFKTEQENVKSNIEKGYKEVCWNFECDSRISYEYINGNTNKTFDFSIFSSTTSSQIPAEIYDSQHLLGIVKLDLSLLGRGFERVYGWYNVESREGDIRGQIKLGVTPMVPIVAGNKSLRTEYNQVSAVVPIKQPLSSSLPPNQTLEDHQSYLESVRNRLRGVTLPNPTTNTQQVPCVTATNESNNNQVEEDVQLVSRSLMFSNLKEKLNQLNAMKQNLQSKLNPQMPNTNPVAQIQSSEKYDNTGDQTTDGDEIRVDELVETPVATDDNLDRDKETCGNYHDENDEENFVNLRCANNWQDPQTNNNDNTSNQTPMHNDMYTSAPGPSLVTRSASPCSSQSIASSICVDNEDDRQDENDEDEHKIVGTVNDFEEDIDASSYSLSLPHFNANNVDLGPEYERYYEDKSMDSWDETEVKHIDHQLSNRNDSSRCSTPTLQVPDHPNNTSTPNNKLQCNNNNYKSTLDQGYQNQYMDPNQNETTENQQRGLQIRANQNRPIQCPETSNNQSVIPKFFPSTLDYGEKLKSLKQNMALTAGRNSIQQANNVPGPRINLEASNTTDERSYQLAKIFGVTK